MSKIKIAICLPFKDTVSTLFFQSFVSLLCELFTKYDVSINMNDKMPVEDARNDLIQMALRSKPDYLLWIDSDSYIPYGAVDKLIKCDKDIVSGLYFCKMPPHLPVIRSYSEEYGVFYHYLGSFKVGDVIPVDGIGFGCALIKRSVIEKMLEDHGERLFAFSYLKNKVTGAETRLSEDLYFSLLARKSGFKCWIATDVIIGHIGGIVNENNFLLYRDLASNDTFVSLCEYTQDKPEGVLFKLQNAFMNLRGEYENYMRLNPNATMRDFYMHSKNYVYDLVSWHMGVRRDFDFKLVEAIKKLDVKTILDIGSGAGDNAILLALAGYDVTMADLDSYTFGFAKHRVNRLKLKNVNFIHLDREQLPDQQWDVILCLDVVEHLESEEEVKRLIDYMKTHAKYIYLTANFVESEHPFPILPLSDDLKNYIEKHLNIKVRDNKVGYPL